MFLVMCPSKKKKEKEKEAESKLIEIAERKLKRKLGFSDIWFWLP
jgi:hypothetical protein